MSRSLIVTKEEKWTEYIQKSFDFDFYHTWKYHAMDRRGDPLLFVYEENNDFIALPLLKRRINGSDLFDLTSVYGYTGPVSNRNFDQFESGMIENFHSSFKEFAQNEKMISLFSRLNPFYGQVQVLNPMGGVRTNGRTVFIDLSESIEQQREKYHKRLCRQIRQLRKQDFLIKETDTLADIEVFTAMYTENMDRLSASSAYYFDAEFFYNIIHTKEFNCRLILIYDGAEVMCGAIVACSKYIIRNHLSATNSSYIKGSPSKLLTDEISLIGRRLGMKYFHMGGGVGGKEDSLFAFKSYFSPLYLEDHIWCYISDEEAYNNLVEKTGNAGTEGYFPLYRNGHS